MGMVSPFMTSNGDGSQKKIKKYFPLNKKVKQTIQNQPSINVKITNQQHSVDCFIWAIDSETILDAFCLSDQFRNEWKII